MPWSRSVPLLAAGVFFALEWVSNAFFGYGVFVDELYYLSCAKRLAAGYVDHPPLSIWLLRGALVLGDSLPALRLWPALAGAGTVYLAARLARRLGGSSRAMWLAAIACAGAPVLLVLFGFYSMNAIELVVVGGLVSIAFEIGDRGRPALWLWFGVLGGLAVLNKHTAAVYVTALLLGMLASSSRHALRSGWLLAGGAAALLIVSPNLIWELRNHWVSLEFYRQATALKNVPSPAWKVVLDQLLSANPAAIPVLLSGVLYGARTDRRMLFVVWAYAGLLFALAASGWSRPDRIVGLLPPLFAAGAVQIDRWAAARPWAPWMAGALALSGACALAPVGLPLLSPPALGAYAQAIGVLPKLERREGTAIPQWFADRFGWDAVARAADRASAQLTPEERRHAAVLGASYGYSGACERFGRDLPPVIGRHNAWHGWGVPSPAPDVLLLIGFPEYDARAYCGQLSIGATFTRPFTIDVERPVFVCRELRTPLPALWPKLRLLM